MLTIISVLLCISAIANACEPSITTSSGFAASQTICKGQLIFEEHFDTLDKTKWKPQVSLWGGGNGEFQWYVTDDENSFAKDGKLHIKPTLTANKIGYEAVEKNHIKLEDCTDPDPANCERQAGGDIIINPIRSARLVTSESFSFKFGHVEVIAKTPQGDWLWPAVWLLPTKWKYGGWPNSGEIDLLESRGNVKYGNDVQIGVEQVFSTLHFGPEPSQHTQAGFARNNASGYHNDFHKYEFIWDQSGFRFFIDGSELGFISANEKSFWQRGTFKGDNIWASGTNMTPFDEEFHFLINLAVGGNNGFFPDENNQNGKKPWVNFEAKAMKDFWTNRRQWLPSWRDREASSFIIDSVKVWAV